MPRPVYRDRRKHLTAIRRAAAEAADAGAAVRKSLRATKEEIFAGGRRFPIGPSSRVFVVALGKAAPAMCEAACGILGDRLEAGLAAVPHSWKQPAPARVRYVRAGHPLPDDGSLAAALAAADLLASTRREDLVLALVSGGGSAMFELPAPGVSLEDLRALNQMLLDSGAPIAAFNTVRRAISRVKGGGLARLASPARTIGLVLSDIVGDRISAIASGPTVLMSADPSPAVQVLRAFGLWSQAPESIRAALQRSGSAGPCPRPHNVLIGGNGNMVDAASQCASRLGFRVTVITRSMQGEARQVGELMARRLRVAARPRCLLMGGETTVRVRGSGRGGRNQELALSAGLALAGQERLALMTYASDGVDGPTDAAGALIDSRIAAALARNVAAADSALQRNDSYTVLQAAGALIRTGPTGTNVADLVVGLVYAV